MTERWPDPRTPRNRNLWLDEPERRRRQRRRRIAALAGGGLALAALGGAGVYLALEGTEEPIRLVNEALALETLSVEGVSRVSAREIVATSGLVAGTPLHAIDVEAVTARLAAHPWVESATVVRVPPSVVVLRITERDPVAVAAEDGGLPHLVDQGGLPFAPAEPDDVVTLPWIVAPHPVRRGEATPELGRAATLTRALRARDLAAGAEVWVAPEGDPEGLSVLVEGLPGRVVLGSGGLEEKLARLATLRASGIEDARTAQVIDLRFAERAVLRSEGPRNGPADETPVTPLGTSPPPGRRS